MILSNRAPHLLGLVQGCGRHNPHGRGDGIVALRGRRARDESLRAIRVGGPSRGLHGDHGEVSGCQASSASRPGHQLAQKRWKPAGRRSEVKVEGDSRLERLGLFWCSLGVGLSLVSFRFPSVLQPETMGNIQDRTFSAAGLPLLSARTRCGGFPVAARADAPWIWSQSPCYASPYRPAVRTPGDRPPARPESIFPSERTPAKSGTAVITNGRPAESIRLHHEMVLHMWDEAAGESGIPPQRRLVVGFSQSVGLNLSGRGNPPESGAEVAIAEYDCFGCGVFLPPPKTSGPGPPTRLPPVAFRM